MFPSRIKKVISQLNVFSLTKKHIPDNIRGIIVLGSSGSGKTTFINHARQSSCYINGSLVIPKRYITRPTRNNDDTSENTFITQDDFLEKTKNGFFSLYWRRCMELSREEWYGFSQYNGFPLFSANNSVFYPEHNVSVFPKDFTKDMLVIGIYAEPDTIKMRLEKRSPDLFKNNIHEVNYRLSDKPDNIKQYSHIVVHNNIDLLSYAEQSITFFNELKI